MKLMIIITLFICLFLMTLSNYQQTLELRQLTQEAETYRRAYERVCAQTRVPITSNFDSVMAKEGFPK